MLSILTCMSETSNVASAARALACAIELTLPRAELTPELLLVGEDLLGSEAAVSSLNCTQPPLAGEEPPKDDMANAL